MSSQKPGKTKQKSLLSLGKPPGYQGESRGCECRRVLRTEIPEGSSESGQDYAAVESVKAFGSQLPLLEGRPNQPRNLSFPSKSHGTRSGPFSRGDLIAIRGCTTECIRTRFNQKDFKVYRSIQERPGTSCEGGSRRRP